MAKPTRCRACGGPLPPYAGRGRPRVWCSQTCKWRIESRVRRERESARWADVTVDELLERARITDADFAASPFG
jgi:hypothetical protein